MQKIQKFTDLIAWKEAHTLVLLIYTHTKDFPDKERFGLTNQLRRAGVSVSSNIAEGFSRRSWKDKKRFYEISKGSLSEAENQILIARDISYLTLSDFEKCIDQIRMVDRLLTGLIQSASRMEQV